MASKRFLDTILLILTLLMSLFVIASLTQLLRGGDILATFTQVTSQIIYVIFAVTIVLIILILVLENSSPVHTLAWIMVLIFLPIVGFIFYLFFGRNWRKIKLFKRKELSDVDFLHALDRTVPEFYSHHLEDGLEHKIHKLLKNNSKAIITNLTVG